jgi:hypothetical protein
MSLRSVIWASYDLLSVKKKFRFQPCNLRFFRFALCSLIHRWSENWPIFVHFNLNDTFVSHKTLEALLHLNHPT